MYFFVGPLNRVRIGIISAPSDIWPGSIHSIRPLEPKRS